MTPSTNSAPADSDPLRRELILAQVQLMELEDARDDLQTRLAAANLLVSDTQRLADSALREQEHAVSEQDRLRTEYEQLAATAADLNAQLADALAAKSSLSARVAELAHRLADRDRALAELTAAARAAGERVVQLDTERRAMKASRSWRWTAPLRAVERAFQSRGGGAA